MTNGARDKLTVGGQHTPGAWKIWASRLLIVGVVVWTLIMMASLRERFLDRFVCGSSHGAIGLDFFDTPRGFRNLIAGNNIYLTELDDYGPYAALYLAHPMVAVAVGPWTAPFAPTAARVMFVGVSLVLLAVSAALLASQLEGRLLRAFTLFALFCAPPTYVMLWLGQMHVWLILAVALILGGLIGLERDLQSSTRSLRMLQIGLLISLLSKPVALLALPVLFATRETRRALILPVATYAVVSVLFLWTPALNSGGYNGIHWLNMVNASSSAFPILSLVTPGELPLVNCPDIQCLPVFLRRLTSTPIPWVLMKLPLLAILAISAIPLFLASRRRRIDVAIATVILCLLSHYLCYYMVWEYHYTTILPTLPVLWWMSQGEARVELRWLLRIAFVVLLANFLPTLYFLAPETPLRYLTASTILRVVPVIIAFVSLLLYGIGNIWVASREGSDGLELPRGQLPEVLRTGAALTISCGAVLAGVYFSVPERLMKPLAQWNGKDWSMHVEDLLPRPHAGLKPAGVASMHLFLGKQYYESDRPKALTHYAAAVDLLSDNPDSLCDLGDRMVKDGQVDLAISVYQRVLELVPNHQVAQERLRQLRNRSLPESR